MGRLTINGKAERNIIADMMKISLTFSSREENAALAVKNMSEHCNDFLTRLEKQGISVSKVHIESDTVENNHGYYSGNQKPQTSASRKISFTLPYSMTFLNSLNQLIQDAGYSVSMQTDFVISNLLEIHNQLIKEAVEDSRQKAEMLAEMMHQKISGFEAINITEKYHHFEEAERGISPPLAKSVCVSDFLIAPEQKESETVEVVWNIE